MKLDVHASTSVDSLNGDLTNRLENQKVPEWKHDFQRLAFIPCCCGVCWAVYNCGNTFCVMLMFKTAAPTGSLYDFLFSSDNPSSNSYKTHMGDFSASSNHNTTTVVPPDLTSKITRSRNQPCDGGAFSDIYKCVYNRDGGTNLEVCMLFHHPTDPAASLLQSR